ncbi:sigma-70 family RNA polymerase sigma factor [Streptomyces sp. NPDC059063]|uniref:sigma-70 family RNA polymerase sigma factor n=1 Tax=unclassified Streptomyces TaxID=2593676 RepID=UPI0036C09E1F
MGQEQWERKQVNDAELTSLVVAGRAGDPRAQDELVAAYLPLVYNIVGRALGGHADVDDTVQEAMMRMLRGLPALRDPASFRSWLVAIAMNETRRRQHPAPVDSGLQDAYDVPDPGSDFTDVTILRLGLSGERREVAQATRWMDDDYREVLALWWLEAAGELSRGEVARALELTPEHTAVRVQRMKAQLETARVVVRALTAKVRCPLLADLTAAWDGRPSALWRKRLARHTRDCAVCAGHGAGLTPAEGLLAGLALVPPLAMAAGRFSGTGGTAYAAYAAPTQPLPQADAPPLPQADALPDAAPWGPSAADDTVVQGMAGDGIAAEGVTAIAPHGAAGSRAQLRQGRRSTRRRRQAVGAGAGIAAIATLAGVMQLVDDSPDARDKGAAVAMESTEPSPAAPSATGSASPTKSPSASPSKSAKKKSPKPSATASPSRASRKKTTKPAPRTSAKPPAPPRQTAEPPAPQAPSGSTAQQVLTLVNAERRKAGCGPLTQNSRLATAAQRHSADMRARNYFDHTSPDGTDPGQRITAAGYKWSTYGENIARGQQTASSVMKSWMNSEGHRANILNCSFKELGVGIEKGSGGPWWTQNFGARG